MTRTLTQIDAELATLTGVVRRYDAGANEGGEGFNPHSAALRILQAEYDQVAEATADGRIAALLAEQEARWTVEYTTARRAEWNTWVNSQGKTLHPATVANRVALQGWSVEALKRAIKRHGV